MPFCVKAQYFLFTDAPADVNLYFTRSSIESAAKSTFFNALVIRNNSNKSESFNLNITVPQGWNVIGKDRIDISLSPLDSIIIPIRIAIEAKVRGDIGYSVIASLTDSRGNTIKNEYCYIRIPRDTDLNVNFIDRTVYLDPVSKSADFSFLIKNRGNRDELINILFDGEDQLGVGFQKETIFSQDLVIPPFSDTLLTYKSSLLQDFTAGKKLFGLKARVSSIDTLYQTSIWFRVIDSKILNYIPANEKPLVIDFAAQGLLDANTKPKYVATIQGKTLFNNDREIFYYYRNYSSSKFEDVYLLNKMLIGSKFGSWKILIGDSNQSVGSGGLGRGINLSYNKNRFSTSLMANKNRYGDIYNYGLSSAFSLDKNLLLNIGLVYSESQKSNFVNKQGVFGFAYSLSKRHNFRFTGFLNQYNRELNNKNEFNEFGFNLNYNSKIGPFTTSLRSRYGTDLLLGPYAGRFEVLANTNWRINQSNSLLFSYNENQRRNSRIEGTTFTILGENRTREGRLNYINYITPNINVFGGPAVQSYKIDGIATFPVNEYFQSVNYKVAIGATFRNETGTATFSPRFEIAAANITNNPFAINDTPNRNWIDYHFLSLTYRSRSFLILAFYASGPRSSMDQINFLYSLKENRRLQFMPSFNSFIYKDIVNVDLGLSYSNDLVSKSIYTNLTGQVTWYLPRYWSVRVLSVYSLQNRRNLQDLIDSYHSFYVEAGINKEFNWDHPRVKYHDVEFVFFKDFNGNFLQEDNEPGIKNILVSLEKIILSSKGSIPGEFYSGELLSDNLGRAVIERIPEGTYKITYNPIGADVGTFSKTYEDAEIRINRDGKYYFPFVEKNKVFGKIILNRSRLSGLGRLDLSNVRVTATDSQGRSYSTLTDKNGEFVLFAPITDEYILTINNIFYENFDLRQNSFLVQFNGYKQFEVNFVFDEKVRRINFAATDQEVRQGVQQVRRTSVSGSVKDVNTQQPIRAKINLINTRTNSIVTSVNSSATSGEYTLNFMAADNYLLEVLADDYWYLSENLVLQQVTTFMNLNRDILLRPISVGSKVELNIRFDVNSAFLNPEAVAELNRLLRQMKNNPSIRLEIQGHCDDLEAIQKPGIGQERAGAVARYLIENGFSNVEVKDMRNSVPTTSNDTEEGRMRNRRIEVVVLRR